jgi:hypothetical protein
MLKVRWRGSGQFETDFPWLVEVKMRTFSPSIWRPKIAVPMGVIECCVAWNAAGSYEFELSAPSCICTIKSARVEAGIRFSGFVICITDTFTGPSVSASVFEYPVAIGALNCREFVILGTNVCVNVYPWTAVPCV